MTATPSALLSTDSAPSMPVVTSQRIASIDVFRGWVMFLMLFQMVKLPVVAKAFEQGRWSKFWGTIGFHTTHVEWEGGSLHDMIQPGFSFLVGAAMAFSLANRRSRGQAWGWMLFHAILRALALIALGVLLRNLKTDQINFRFEDTLCQIGLGYVFLFLIASLRPVWHWVAFSAILLGVWLAFVSYPVAAKDFDYASVGVPADWPYHQPGIAAHWNKNANIAAAFDRWFLNLFPRAEAFTANEGGYTTLNFIPTLATMILGLIAGRWLRDGYSLGERSWRFLAAILLGWGTAWLISYLGLCPIVKRLWTPTWVLWSGGWCLLFLYCFHLICDVAGWKAWAFPWTVIGANSIAAYVMSYATVPFFVDRLRHWFGFVWAPLDKNQANFLIGLTAFALVWLILFWMYRRRLYIRL
jgi:predicted acyltransferase